MPSGMFPKSLIQYLVSRIHLVKKSVWKIQKSITFALANQICCCWFSLKLPIGAKGNTGRPSPPRGLTLCTVVFSVTHAEAIWE